MSTYSHQVSGANFSFDGLVELMAKATPLRSGDELAGCAAQSDAERAAAQWALSDVSLDVFLEDLLVPYESDEVTRLIIDSHDRTAFGAISHLTVGGLRDWLLDAAASKDSASTLRSVAPGLTPEMVAAVSKIMRNQDLISVA
ncbi:MAG: ethanolamine ammonia-lyase subunit EutB, partial [Rhodococcus fascians]